MLQQIRAHQGEKHRALVALLLEARVWLGDLTPRDRRAWHRFEPRFVPALEHLLVEHQTLLRD